MRLIFSIYVFLLSLAPGLSSYEVTLHGGGELNIPETWVYDNSDPAVPTWYSLDRRAGLEVLLWAPGTWDDLEIFIDNVRPEGAEGEVYTFKHWDAEIALANWAFTTSSGSFRGWFLLTSGIGPDVRISAIAEKKDFEEVQMFLLSAIDSYIPQKSWNKSPGAIGHFLEITNENDIRSVDMPFGSGQISWNYNQSANMASQDVIEREALVLAAYSQNPDLFYKAWTRYYRIIYRDSYRRFDPIIEALKNGPINPEKHSGRDLAEEILRWLQGFTYGSTNGFSDLLAPAEACAKAIGDCDSLALAMLIILDSYGINGRILISHQASHAIAAVDVPGKGLRFVDGDSSWLAAELTAELPLGELPDRLSGVNDWFSISFDGS